MARVCVWRGGIDKFGGPLINVPEVDRNLVNFILLALVFDLDLLACVCVCVCVCVWGGDLLS